MVRNSCCFSVIYDFDEKLFVITGYFAARLDDIVILNEYLSMGGLWPSSLYPLKAKNNVTINGNAVASGKENPFAFVQTDGVRGEESQTLYDLEPDSFPANASNTNASDADSPFNAVSDVYYKDVTIGANKTATFTGGGPFHLKKLKIKANATVNLAAGTYYIGTVEMKDNDAVINITSEPVILHIGTEFKMDGKDLIINSGGNVTGFRVFLHDGAKFNKDAKGDRLDFTGLVYGTDTDKTGIGKNATFHGAIIASKVKVDNNVAITYSAADQSAVSALVTCNGGFFPHFGIESEGSFGTCAAGTVTISRFDSNHAIDTIYSGTISLSTSSGNDDWSLLQGDGSFSNSGGGAASYTYDAADQGQVVLGFTGSIAETPGVDVTDGSASEYSGKDDPIEVVECPGTGSCGVIPDTFPISAGGDLTVNSNLTMNGNSVASGTAGPDAVVATDGSRSDPLAQALPPLNPPFFPANTSALEATGADSPINNSGVVYYKKISANNGETVDLTGGGTFHINELKWDDDGTINMAAGTYFVNKFHMHGDRARLNVTSEPVILFVGSELRNHGLDQVVNSGGSVTGLRVFLYPDVDSSAATEDHLDFTGLIYGHATGEVNFGGDDLNFNGAIITAGDVVIGDDASFTYSAADAADVAAISTCGESTTDHLSITHDGTGINYQTESITLSAHASDDTVVTSYVETVTLSTDTLNGDWTIGSALGTLVNSGNGSATYAFVAGDNGSVVLGFKDTFVETVNLNAVQGSLSEDEDASIVFAQSGFNFLSASVKDTIGTQIAGKPSNQFGGAPALEIEAVDTSTDTGLCEAALQGSVVIPLAFECENPIACTANQVTINGTAIAANGNDSVSSYTDVTLDFGDATDTTATLVFNYDDAGQVKLHARYEIPLEGGGGSGNLMNGASNGFVVRPFGFDIDFSDDRATAGGVSDAADANGSVFAKAGVAFDAQVTAVLWQSADDGDQDGLPDTGANLTDNPATLNFGQELSSATAAITRTLFEPSGGDAGTLTGGSGIGGFSSGVATASLSWDEVGIIHLNAAHSDYLGGGVDIDGVVNNVGRFVPARFGVSPSGFAFRNGPDGTWGCGFTYLDQLFAYSSDPVLSLTGRNASGLVTLNYGSSFWKFSGGLGLRAYTNTQATTATLDAPALGTVALSEQTDLDGDGDLTISSETFAYLKPSAPAAEFSAQVTLTLAGGDLATAGDLQDSDGVCYHPTAASCNVTDGDSYPAYTVTGITGSTLRFGRLRLTNANGSELLPITLPMITERFDGAGFVTHTADICTSIATTFIDLDNDLEDPAQGDAEIDTGAATTTAGIANSPFVAGDGGLIFSAPGAGNTGHADTTFNLSLATGAAMPWLRYDWDGDGNHDNDPSARATFGVYQGSQYLIFIREPW